MVTIAEPLPIGTRVRKPLEWNSITQRTGTTQSPVYRRPGKRGFYVDVLWDHNRKVEACHLSRLVRLPEAADA